MFPIRDHNPSERTPLIVYALIAVNVAVFLLGLGQSDAQIARFYYDYALIPARLSAGENPAALFTSMFLHGGFMHIAGNMLFLWVFGDNMEDEMGHLGFLLFYLAGGIGAGLAQYVGEPLSPIPMVGASGAIAGVMGGYLLLFPRARVDVLIILIVIFRVIPVPAWITLGLWFALQLLSGVGADPSTGGIAYWAHAGGFLIGLVLTVPLWARRGGPSFWSRTHGHPPHPDAHYRFQRTNVPKVRRR